MRVENVILIYVLLILSCILLIFCIFEIVKFKFSEKVKISEFCILRKMDNKIFQKIDKENFVFNKKSLLEMERITFDSLKDIVIKSNKKHMVFKFDTNAKILKRIEKEVAKNNKDKDRNYSMSLKKPMIYIPLPQPFEKYRVNPKCNFPEALRFEKIYIFCRLEYNLIEN